MELARSLVSLALARLLLPKTRIELVLTRFYVFQNMYLNPAQLLVHNGRDPEIPNDVPDLNELATTVRGLGNRPHMANPSNRALVPRKSIVGGHGVLWPYLHEGVNQLCEDRARS